MSPTHRGEHPPSAFIASGVTLGYAIGALLAGLTADAFGLNVAMWVIAALTFLSGVVSATRMGETLPARARTTPRADGEVIDDDAPLATSPHRGDAETGVMPGADGWSRGFSS